MCGIKTASEALSLGLNTYRPQIIINFVLNRVLLGDKLMVPLTWTNFKWIEKWPSWFLDPFLMISKRLYECEPHQAAQPTDSSLTLRIAAKMHVWMTWGSQTKRLLLYPNNQTNLHQHDKISIILKNGSALSVAKCSARYCSPEGKDSLHSQVGLAEALTVEMFCIIWNRRGRGMKLNRGKDKQGSTVISPASSPAIAMLNT